MKFIPLTDTTIDNAQLSSEYKASRSYKNIRLGELDLFFRSGLKTYFIPYRDIRRCFRRVMLIPAKMRAGKGSFELETIVICGESGELAQIQTHGKILGKELMAELERRVPEAEFGKPDNAELTGL